MGKTSRIEPLQLSQEVIDGHTAQTCYKAGYGYFIVNSKFNGDKPPCELFFEILSEKHIKNCSGMP